MSTKASRIVMESRARSVASGAYRFSTYLPAEAARALDGLVQSGYASSKSAAAARAIVEVWRKKNEG